MTDIRYFDWSGDTVRSDPKSTYSFAQIFALTRSETRDSRSKVTLENVFSGFSVGKVSLPAATVFVNASISFDAASSTTVGWTVGWVFVPEFLSAGARFVWTMPTDCNAPEIACEIIAPSSVGLNCEEDSGGCAELSGRAVELGRLFRPALFWCDCRGWSFCCLALWGSFRRHSYEKCTLCYSNKN